MDDIDSFLASEFAEHATVFAQTKQAVAGCFGQALDALEATVRQGGKILLFGNGGSASDAQHIAAELVIRYKQDRLPIAAIALTTDTSALTACGNDLGFECLFERQVEALGRGQDVAIGISTSGNSQNVLRGVSQAKKIGMRTIGLVGSDGGQLKASCDISIVIPSKITARIQEMHILIGHMLCKALEQRLGLV
jgi:D-sedoheptulose 7-phosphate isomerase